MDKFYQISEELSCKNIITVLSSEYAFIAYSFFMSIRSFIPTTNQNFIGGKPKRYMIDVNGTLHSVVELDEGDFKKVTRNSKAFANYIYSHLLGVEIEVFDKNGEIEIIEFAKVNERVKKDGVKNYHKVVCKLTQERSNTKKLIIVNLIEIIKNSEYLDENFENSHQWLDEKGWEIRKCFVMKKKGNIIYPVVLSIGRTRDGRNILYSANIKINEGVTIDKDATS